MELDDKAINFLKQAKASGVGQEEAFNFLRSKGYDLEQEKPTIGEKPEQFRPTKTDVLTSALKGFSFGIGNPVIAGLGAATEKIRGNKQPFMDLVGEYGQAIEDRQQEFAQNNPKTQFAAELSGVVANLPVAGVGSAAAKGAGRVLSSVAPRAASNILAKGVVEGAAFGLPYTGIEQAREVLSGKESLSKGIIGATKGTLANAALGGVIPLTGRGIAKIIGTKGEQGRQAAKILNKAGDKSIESIVRTDKGTGALQSAIKSSEDLAAQIRDIADKKIISSADRATEIISKELGADDIQSAKKAAGNAYQSLFDKYKNKSITKIIGNKPSTPIYDNPTVIDALKTAKKQDLLGEMAQSGDNSLLSAQRTKEVLDDMIQGSKVAGDFGKQQNTNLTRQLTQIRDNFVKKVDFVVPEYKSVRSAYKKAKQANDLLDNLIAPTGRERSNTISSLLTNENKQLISDIYGANKANRLFEELRQQGIENNRFNKLYSAAEQKLTREPAEKRGLIREALESTGSIIGQGLDIATFNRRGRMRKGIADILLGNKPMPKSDDNISKQFIRGAVQLKAAKGE